MRYSEAGGVHTPDRLKVADVLVNYGKDVGHPRYGLIKSPFRDERTPSFHIMPGGYGWVDFGEGTKGGVIDLIMRLDGCGREAAIRRIAEIKGGGRFYVPQVRSSSSRPRPASSRFRVVASGPFSDHGLIGYAASRGISLEVLSEYCSEVTVRTGGGSVRAYIGFPNSGDGYVLRSPEPGRDGKRCTCSAPSYVSDAGKHTAAPSCREVVVFEGLFDFLSFVERRKSAGVAAPGSDVCVLNSVSNVRQALPFISAHAAVSLYLDNDEAGRKASVEIRDSSPESLVVDHSVEYAAFGDYGEYHQATM